MDERDKRIPEGPSNFLLAIEKPTTATEITSKK
jgi:hypothetical protein